MLLIPPKDIAAIIAQPDGTRLVAEVIDTAYRLSQIPPPRCRVCRQPTHVTDPALSQLQRQLNLLRRAPRSAPPPAAPPDQTPPTPTESAR